MVALTGNRMGRDSVHGVMAEMNVVTMVHGTAVPFVLACIPRASVHLIRVDR